MLDVTIKVLDPRHGTEWNMPEYGTESSAGIDLRACIDKSIILKPGDVVLIPTGLAVAMPNETVEMAATILPRSGLGHKEGIVLGNGVGLIDSDYRGQVFVSVWYRENPAVVVEFPIAPQTVEMKIVENEKTHTIEPGDRIAQLVFLPVIRINPKFTTDDLPTSERGSGGFGHTGKS